MSDDEVMNMFHIPDIGLLELRQRNSPSSSKWRRKCKNHVWYRCNTRKHHVPAFVQYLYQRSVAGAHGQNQGISHGLQIGKDQDDSSQDADHGYQFNNIGFIDDISIFAETPEGMQALTDEKLSFAVY